MILIDTGYLLALLRPNDSLFERAQAWALVTDKLLAVTHYVLLETGNALSDPRDRPKFHQLLVDFASNPQIEIVPATASLWKSRVDLHAQRSDKAWSLADCISFVVMQQLGISRALAYDHHFEQAGFKALLRRDPP